MNITNGVLNERRGQLIYRQWEAFAHVVKSLNINRKILCSVYYRRHKQLVLPGSNLNSLIKEFDQPGKLDRALQDYCPNLDNSRDNWAADFACNHFLKKGTFAMRDSCIIAPFTWDTEEFPVYLVNKDGTTNALHSSVKLPNVFLNFLHDSFMADDPKTKNIVFSACPVYYCPSSPNPKIPPPFPTEHVAIFYIALHTGVSRRIYRTIVELLLDMRELMALGIMAFEIENETIWQNRLKRIRSPEAKKDDYVSKLYAGDPTGMQQQVQQIEYLAKTAKRSNQRQLLYPKVTPKTGEVPYYMMPKYNLPPLRNLICSPLHPLEKELEQIVERLMESLFAGIYVPTKNELGRSTASYAKSLKSNRLKRWGKILQYLTAISKKEPILYRQNAILILERESHRVLKALLDPATQEDWAVKTRLSFGEVSVEIDVPIRPLDRLNMKKDGLEQRLSCATLTAVHGDLHFGNVLVDCFLPSDPLFLFLDPRGVKKNYYRNSDPATDVAKLLFSCNAGYDFVDTGHFDIDIEPRHDARTGYRIDVTIPSSKTLYNPMGGGASAAELFSIEESLPRQTEALYKEAARVIRYKADELARSELRDRNLLDRAQFYEALYCLCLAESHYIYKPDGALAMFLRGYKLLDKWLKTPPQK